MGRRKIEIKAIKDDRNRSVTFLKRKGGLFKKAHELAVLCSVDVAVIIFGHNKKLYEYSSCDMHEALGRYQYFGGPHEHKGPDDFSGKRDDDDEEDEDHTPAPEDMQIQQTHTAVPPHLQQPGFQHVNHAPSASPPIPNGLPTRHGTPNSQISRPSSRNTQNTHVRRVSSNLGPHHGTPPPPPAQNGYYMANPSMYNPNVHSAMNQPRPAQYAQYAHPPGPQGTPPQGMPHPHGLPQQMPQQHFQHAHAVASQQMGMPPGSHAPVQQVTQAYMADQGRGSMPPSFAPDTQKRNMPEIPERPDNPSGGLKPDSQSPPQPKFLSKSRSIFTPIDDGGSVLARHFGAGPSMYESPRVNQNIKPDTSHEASGSKPESGNAVSEPPRTQSISSSVSDIKPIQRMNSGQLPSKRPQLKVQIPDECSDRGSATADSSSRDSAGNKTTPARGNGENPTPGGVVLPPPSPSAGAILSAGAQGPPNPFARPPPPVTQPHNNAFGNSMNNGNNSNNIETPISALPSRFVSDALLPSPSSFFPEWGFGRSGPDSSLLPSPLNFPTPALQSGPSFAREDEQDKKRKSPDSGSQDDGASKKPKT
ncbi:hypothetical protein N7513_006482 [Penicillium frequentans]|uniref:MADS-box domain-containing protein n=1 Tax=Penicillium frequentans TaxID=3151616 RepID=A0AAD6CWG1_9EURO|nr:hypothetical protein N7494_008015 [Penicillium glabrum]KAJ5549248.1 hypothetical protein N7513_006482 [Penicillium glabrum]